MTAPGKRGRPPLGDNVARLHIRVPREALTRYAAAASSKGQLLSEWVRRALDRAAVRTRKPLPAYAKDRRSGSGETKR